MRGKKGSGQRGSRDIGREQFGRRDIRPIELAALRKLLHQPLQPDLEGFFRPGVVVCEQCQIAIAQIRRVREPRELSSGRRPQLQRPCQRLAINRRSRSLTQYG